MKKILIALMVMIFASPVFAHQKLWSCYAQSPTWWGHSDYLKTEEAARLLGVATCASGTAVGLRCVVIDCHYKFAPQPEHMKQVPHHEPSKFTWKHPNKHLHK